MAKTGRRKKIRLPNALDQWELEALLNAPSKSSVIGIRDRCILALMGYCGLRVGEICGSDARKTPGALPGLKISDLHLREDPPHIRVIGKRNKERRAWPPLYLQDLLRAWLEIRPKCGRGNALFPVIKSTRGGFAKSQPGRSVSTQGVRKMIKRYARKAGIERRVHPHMLRHTAGTMMAQKPGATTDGVAKFLGHSDSRTALIYEHTSDERQVRLSQQMGPHEATEKRKVNS